MDNETRKLFKQSLLRIPSEDFTNRMMQKIHAEVRKEPQVDSGIIWSWFFVGLAALILPIGLMFLFSFLTIYDPYMTQYIQRFSDNIFLQLPIIIAMALILLFQLDNLIRMTWDHRK